MSIFVRDIGVQPYPTTLSAMKEFTHTRTPDTTDELWTVEHPSVFTQGQAGKSEHVLKESPIPIIQSDRGGQITYHGPGQLVVYTLIALKRYQLSVRQLVTLLEMSIVQVLRRLTIEASSKKEAPGVYVGQSKIASLGLRIRRGFAYHGLALNVDMDLSPFSYINPCGFNKLPITQLKDHLGQLCPSMATVKQLVVSELLSQLGYEASNLEFDKHYQLNLF